MNAPTIWMRKEVTSDLVWSPTVTQMYFQSDSGAPRECIPCMKELHNASKIYIHATAHTRMCAGKRTSKTFNRLLSLGGACKNVSKTWTHMRMHQETKSRNQVHPRLSHVRSNLQTTMFFTCFTVYPIYTCSITWVATKCRHTATRLSAAQAQISVHGMSPSAQRTCSDFTNQSINMNTSRNHIQS